MVGIQSRRACPCLPAHSEVLEDYFLRGYKDLSEAKAEAKTTEEKRRFGPYAYHVFVAVAYTRHNDR
jgi:hypothetical protein